VNDIEKIQQIAEKAIKDIQEAAANAVKVEKEYRGGEWVPGINSEYYAHNYDGDLIRHLAVHPRVTERHVKTGYVFPTEGIAKAAKSHADWWREFDMSDEGGLWFFWVTAGSKIKTSFKPEIYYDGTPRYKTEESARAAVERLGGEQKVIDMLTRGRVFRFKWGGE
jgi:hypothetical protein